MATSGSCETSAYNNRKWVKFNWSRSGTVNNSSECYSNIYFELYGVGTDSTTWHWAGPIKVYINKTSGTPDFTFWADRQQLKNGTFIGSNSFRIDHDKSNGEGSFSVYIECAIYSNSINCYGSEEWVLDALPRKVNITSFSVSKRDETSVSFNWSTDADCDWAWYSTDNGATWAELYSNVVGTLSSNTSQPLSANTNYNFKIRLRRTDSQLTTDSGTYSQTTYNYPHCTNAPSFIIGNTLSLSIYNPLGRSFNATIVGDNGITKITGPYNSTSVSGFIVDVWKDFWYSTIPNKTSGTYKVIISYGNSNITTNGGIYSVIGTEKPTFASFTYRDTGKDSILLTGDNQIIINNHNNVEIVIPPEYKAIANNSASMKRYRAVCGNLADEQPYSADSEVVLTLPYITNRTITVYAIDSREISTPVSIAISNDNWKDYSDIVIKSGLVERESGVGTNTTLTFEGTIWNNTFGAVDNEIVKCQYRYKKSNESEYGDPIDITATREEDLFSFNSTIKGDLEANGFNASNSFNIQIIIEDKIRTAIYNILLGAGNPAIAIHQDGVAIGGPYDETLGGPCQVNGHILSYSDTIQVYDNSQITMDFTESWSHVKLPLSNYRSTGSAFTFDTANQQVILNKDGIVDVDMQLNVYANGYANGDYIPTVAKNGVGVGSFAYIHVNTNLNYFKTNGHVHGIVCKAGDVFNMALAIGNTGTLRTFSGELTGFTLKYRRS